MRPSFLARTSEYPNILLHPRRATRPVSERDADGGLVWSVGLDRTGDRQPCLDLLGGVDLLGGPLQLAATAIGTSPGSSPW